MNEQRNEHSLVRSRTSVHQILVVVFTFPGSLHTSDDALSYSSKFSEKIIRL